MIKKISRQRKKTPLRKTFKSLRTVVTWAILLLGLISGGQFVQERVVHVSDGDTFHVVSGVETQKIRLYGIDCPESNQPGGMEATAFASQALLFTTVSVHTLYTDPYGRKVALVYLPDGTSINEELVRNGHAWVYPQYCREAVCAHWKILEHKARTDKRGLWQKEKAIAPWKWRQKRNS